MEWVSVEHLKKVHAYIIDFFRTSINIVQIQWPISEILNLGISYHKIAEEVG